MFGDIPQPVLNRMAFLEAVDGRDRFDGTPKMQRLRQIPAESGRFLAFLAASAPAGNWIEVGASGGYSGLWLSLACRLRNQKLMTFEVLPEKVRLANETFQAAEVSDLIELVHSDARLLLASYHPVGFCFLDAEKDIYLECYEQVIPNMAVGGFLVADNVINHQEELKIFIDRVFNDRRVDALIAPIGKGLLVCRKV